MDNDARFNDHVAISTEVKNLKDVIKQQHDTIQFLKERKVVQVANTDQLPGAEKVRLTEEVFNLRQQVSEL